MLSRTTSHRAYLQLPRRRGALRILFLLVVLPAAVVATTGSNTGCALLDHFFDPPPEQRAEEDPFPVGFSELTLDISFPDPDGSEVIGNKKRVVLAKMTHGLDTLYPAGTITIAGTATAGSVSGAKVPRKVDVELDTEAARLDGRAGVFESTVKFKKGKATQSDASFAGMTLTPDNSLKIALKPKGGAITDDQTYILKVSYAPTMRAFLKALDAYDALRAATIARGYALLRELPFEGATLPFLIRPGHRAKANAKIDALRVRFGAGFTTGDLNLTLAGGFFDSDSGEVPRPKSAKVFIVIRDSEGNRKLSTTFKLKVNGSNIPPVTKLLEGLEIEPDDVLDVKYSPKGGDIEPDDNMFVTITVVPPS